MMTEVKLNDVTLWVEYDFNEGEEQTYDYVGSAPDVDLYSVFVGTQDIYNLLDANQLEFAKSYFINKYNFQTTDPQDRLLFAFDKIITPHAEDREFINLPPFLYYLYYLVRPIRLIGKSKVLFRPNSSRDV